MPRFTSLRSSLSLPHLTLGLASVAGTWLSHGLTFVTASLYGWGRLPNLLLSAGLGITYVAGALSAPRISSRIGRRRLLLTLYPLLSLLSVLIAFAPNAIVFTTLAALWTFLIAMNWPALEALVCHGPTATSTSRRVGLFNLNWSATGALAVVLVSRITAISPSLVFLLSAACTALGFLGIAFFTAPDEPHADLEPEPALLAQRTLAKRLARIALPASYTILYTLSPILANLPALKSLPPIWQSPAASIWLIARFLGFAFLISTSFWHTRPRYLLLAILTALLAFLAATLPIPALTATTKLTLLLTAQFILGLAVAYIYYSSLYFGMVLAHAGEAQGSSTEQGGHHEALIGAGIILGPSLAATTTALGTSPTTGPTLIVLTALAASTYTILRRRDDSPPKN